MLKTNAQVEGAWLRATLSWGAGLPDTIYITCAAAPGAYETVLDLGCRSATGLRPHEQGELEPGATAADRAVVDAIFDNVFAASAGLEVKRVDGTTMVYDPSQTGHTAATLLSREDGHGQCSAWADLLYQTLTAQGIGATKKWIDRVGNLGFEVAGAKVQGDIQLSPPQTQFGFHSMVHIDVYPDRVYDPAFGVMTERKTAATVWQQWEDDHVLRLEKLDGTWDVNPAGADLRWSNSPF